MTDRTVEITDSDREYTLDELSRLADVSPRTVRYYIVEGLLPPPLSTGRNATYSQEHLDRLHAIAAMKEMYLPLREIRHRLNTLTPEQMRDPAYLASLSQAVAMDRAMGKRHGDHARREFISRMESAPEGSRHRHQRRREQRTRMDRGIPAMSPKALATEPDIDAAHTWERFPLGDDAELMIRSSKAKTMGPRLHRTLHQLRHIIDSDTEEERNS